MINEFDQDKFDQLSEAGILSDSSGRIIQINAEGCEFFGYDRKDLLGQTLDKIIPERFRGDHWRHFSQWFDKPYLRPIILSPQVFCLHSSGREIKVEIGLHPVKYDNKIAVRAIITSVED